MPSFRQVLEGVWRAWTEQRAEVVAAGQRLVGARSCEQARAERRARCPAIDRRRSSTPSMRRWRSGSTRINGSWGGAPKFPQPMTIEYLLRRSGGRRRGLERDGPVHARQDGRRRDPRPAGRRVPSLRDRRRTGWCRTSSRCSTTTRSSRGCTSTPGPRPASRTGRYRDVAVGALEYLLRELDHARRRVRLEPGRRHRGRRGTDLHVARPRRSVTSSATTPPRVPAAYGVTDEGNWEGVTILSRVWPDTRHAAAVARRTRRSRRGSRTRGRRLFARRTDRPQPARDDKALAAWNGLAIAALADAGRLLGEPRYQRGRRAASAITAGLLSADGVLRAPGRMAAPSARACSRTTRISPRVS